MVSLGVYSPSEALIIAKSLGLFMNGLVQNTNEGIVTLEDAAPVLRVVADLILRIDMQLRMLKWPETPKKPPYPL